MVEATEPLVLEQATPRYKLFGLIDLVMAAIMLGLFILFYFFTQFTAMHWPFTAASDYTKLMPALKDMSFIPAVVSVLYVVRGTFYVLRRNT